MKAYLEVAQLMLARVEGGIYEPGARLPSERQLAEELGVSRPTIREALAALELQGVVETQVGAGSYVRRGARINGRRAHQPASDASPSELLDTRLLIEPRIARVAASLRTRATLAAMARPLRELERAAEAGAATYNSAIDRRFHAGIAAATENSVLQEVVTPLWEQMGQGLWEALSQRAWTAADTALEARDHRHIYEAIRARDGDLAAFAMETHLRNVRWELFSPEPAAQSNSERPAGGEGEEVAAYPDATGGSTPTGGSTRTPARPRERRRSR